MKSVNTQIKENRKISEDFYKLRFLWKREWGEPIAGNFCEIKVNGLSAPLLRRPFAFSDYAGYPKKEDGFFAEIIYQKRGTATEILTQKAAGENLEIIAPLGNSFYENTSHKRRIYAVAGGVGFGPILFAAKTAPFPVILLSGFRSKAFVPQADVFHEIATKGIKTQICTDDGSDGFHGNVVQFLETTDINSEDLILACGPVNMLKALHGFAEKRNITCKVSTEEMMACGVGACMGCVILDCEGKHRRVCKEGPVFNSRELMWQSPTMPLN